MVTGKREVPASVDDNIWEYPFGELEEDDEIFYRRSESGENGLKKK